LFGIVRNIGQTTERFSRNAPFSSTPYRKTVETRSPLASIWSLCGTRAAEKSVQTIPPFGSSVQRVAADSVAVSSARTAPTVATAADATTVVDYQGLLARQFAARDAQNLLKSRRTLALNDLTRVLVDQLVAIGAEVDETTQALYAAEDFDAAVARKRVASYKEKQATLAAALEKM
jgi:hypothetical protein